MIKNYIWGLLEKIFKRHSLKMDVDNDVAIIFSKDDCRIILSDRMIKSTGLDKDSEFFTHELLAMAIFKQIQTPGFIENSVTWMQNNIKIQIEKNDGKIEI